MMQSDNQQMTDAFTKAGLAAAHSMLNAFEEFARNLSAANPFLNLQQKSCCDIPPACWLPRCFGSFDSQACPCGTALLRVLVTNCQATPSTVAIDVRSEPDLEAKLVPKSATLGPMQRKWFTVSVTIPEDACKGQVYDVVVWVAGCNEHYARWQVRVADGASGTCVEARVDDCPDYVHHWYDHYYCARPCFSRSQNVTDERISTGRTP